MNEDWLNRYWYIVLAVALWELIWKAMALWRAANNQEKTWFVLLLVINSVGILPIAYLYIFSKHPKNS